MNEFNRFIFTDTKPSKCEVALDYALAMAIGGSLVMFFLCVMDAL